MATRDRTDKFLEFRNRKNPFYNQMYEDDHSDTSQLMLDRQKFKMKKQNPPFFFDYEMIKKELHNLSQQVNSAETTSEVILNQLTVLNKKIERFFPREYLGYPKVVEEGCKYPSGESETSFILKKNLRHILVTEFNTVTRDFRTNQKEFVKKAKSANTVAIHFNFDENVDNDDYDFFGRSYTQVQQQRLNRNTMEIQNRLQGIKQIHRSVNQLTLMFQQVNTMITEQGTLIDTVEHNLENTGKEIKEGVKNIEEADTLHQKSSKLNTAIAGLAVACVVVAVLIVVVKLVKS